MNGQNAWDKLIAMGKVSTANPLFKGSENAKLH